MTSKKPRSISLKSKSSLRFIRSLFHYKNGKLYWKPRPRSHFGTNQSYSRWNNRYPGRPAGSFQKGYVKTAIFKVNYAVHRLIFFYHHGYVPTEIDHINGNRLDNRIQNLRPADKFRNKWNAKKHKDKSGIKGVMKRGNVYEAYISANHRRYYLGTFKRKSDAVRVVIRKRKELHGEFARAY